MLFMEKLAVFCENFKKHKYTLWTEFKVSVC
jgi:hypothetical protein